MDYVCLTGLPLPLPKGPELCLSTKSKLRLGGDVRRFVRIRKEAAPSVNRLFCPDFRAPDGSIPSTPSSSRPPPSSHFIRPSLHEKRNEPRCCDIYIFFEREKGKKGKKIYRKYFEKYFVVIFSSLSFFSHSSFSFAIEFTFTEKLRKKCGNPRGGCGGGRGFRGR